MRAGPSFRDVPCGAHVAWLWSAAHRLGEGVTREDLVEHYTRDGLAREFWFSGTEQFRIFARQGFLSGARLRRIGVTDDATIVARIRTARGLDLDWRVRTDPADDHRILAQMPALPGGASFTAVAVASSRAAHYANDRPRVLDDHLAATIAGEFAATWISQVHGDPLVRGGRWMVAARSRWAEDTLTALSPRIDQYVLLGAGLDTFAFRRTDARRGLRVYEVDRPSSQTWKRARLRQLGVDERSAVFVPLDFAREDLDEKLALAGFDHGRPSVVAWLGVTPYLTEAEVRGTLARLATWAPGSWVVFDFYVPERLWDSFGEPWSGEAMRSSAAAVALAGEPFASFFTADDVESLLHEVGFVDVDHLDHDRVRADFLCGRTARAPGPEPWLRVVRARVPR